MLDEAVGLRYAQTFFLVASEQNKIEAWKHQLELIVSTVDANSFLSKILKSPSILRSVKKDIMVKVFELHVDVPVLNLVKILIDKGRAGYLALVLKMYHQQIMINRGVISSVVRTAVELSPAGKARMNNALSQKMGSSVESEFIVDASLLGGVVVTVDGKIIDGSLNRRMDELKSLIVNAPIDIGAALSQEE